MTNASYDYLTKSDGTTKIKVDAAERDGDGRQISSFYVRKGQLKTVGGSSLFNTTEGTVQNIPFPDITVSTGTSSGSFVKGIAVDTTDKHKLNVTLGNVTYPDISVSDTGTGAIVTDVTVDNTDKHKLALTRGTVVNNNTSVTWNTSTTIATIAGTAINIKIPANPNTHYTAVPILGASNATSNATSATANTATYLNIIENNAKSDGVQITGSGGTTVSAKSGKLTITSPSAYASSPAALGTADAGTSGNWARGDHVHPKPSASDIGALASDTAFATINGTSVKSNTAFSLFQVLGDLGSSYTMTKTDFNQAYPCRRKVNTFSTNALSPDGANKGDYYLYSLGHTDTNGYSTILAVTPRLGGLGVTRTNLYIGHFWNGTWQGWSELAHVSEVPTTYVTTVNGSSGAITGIATTTQLTDGTVTKVGTSTVGGTLKIMYLNNGTPTNGTQLYSKNININGTNQAVIRSTNADVGTVYAPTSAGTSGQLVKSNSSGAPGWINQSALTPGVSLAQSGSSGTTLAASTWYTLTVGGSTCTFKTTPWTALAKGTASAVGTAGYAPAPPAGTQDGTSFLSSAASWVAQTSLAPGVSLAKTGSGGTSLAANTIYTLTVGASTCVFKTPLDTTYSSKAAASGGTDVSLVTTGEKYTWNNKPSTDTQNTCGAGDSSSKLFLVGRTGQSTGVSNSNQYVYTQSGVLYANSPAPTTKGLRNITLSADAPASSDGANGDIWICPDSTLYQEIEQDGIQGAVANRYAACSTAAATAAKTASIKEGTFTLKQGTRVTVVFTYMNTANSPTLNINGTGGFKIYHRGTQITSGTNKNLLQGACDFVYDGTRWLLIGNYTVNNGTLTIKTAAGTTLGTFTANSSSSPTITLPNGTLQVQNVSVTFSSDSTYSSYPYRASVTVTGATANSFADVVFSDEQAKSGIYAPFCVTGTNVVYIYARSNPGTQTIPTVSVGFDNSALTVDATPTSGSTNAVTSGGVYNALNPVQTTVSSSYGTVTMTTMGKLTILHLYNMNLSSSFSIVLATGLPPARVEADFAITDNNGIYVGCAWVSADGKLVASTNHSGTYFGTITYMRT